MDVVSCPTPPPPHEQVNNVLQSHECAKRVLREVCILRRMRHPNIIALLDVFLQVRRLPTPCVTACSRVGGERRIG